MSESEEDDLESSTSQPTTSLVNMTPSSDLLIQGAYGLIYMVAIVISSKNLSSNLGFMSGFSTAGKQKNNLVLRGVERGTTNSGKIEHKRF